MAGFEIVVRPVVFPDIRPQSPRTLPPEDDPEKGFCEIKGAGSFIISMTRTDSYSISYGKQKEIKRRADTARVYQQDPSGKVNKKNYVDIQVANKIWQQGATWPEEMNSPERTGRKGGRGSEKWVEYYKKVPEKENVEIKKKNEIIQNNEPIDK
jgi:hypothetical protein